MLTRNSFAQDLALLLLHILVHLVLTVSVFSPPCSRVSVFCPPDDYWASGCDFLSVDEESLCSAAMCLLLPHTSQCTRILQFLAIC